MGTYYFLTDSKIKSYDLTPGTEAHATICHHLKISASSSLEEIIAAFEEKDWFFDFDDTKIIGLEANEDSEIPDPDELKSIANIFIPGSWIEWEIGGDHTRIMFENGQMIWADALPSFFPPDVFHNDDLTAEIKRVEEHLSTLKQRVN